MTPHFKQGSREDLDNYRPVCNLVELGNLVELVTWNQLMDHCLKHKLIHPNHQGSLPYHSPTTAVGHVQDVVSRAMDRMILASVVPKD